MNEREMDLEDLITSRIGDVLRFQAYADNMQKARLRLVKWAA